MLARFIRIGNVGVFRALGLVVGVVILIPVLLLLVVLAINATDEAPSEAAQAAVRVRDIQKSLNQMSRDERIEFIRNNGDPKISVTIGVRGENDAAANSQIAENLLKERIKLCAQ